MRVAIFIPRPNIAGILIRTFGALTLVALLTVAAAGQNGHTEKVTDGSTPSGLASGSTAGSYSLSGFESVNPYNGGLNFSLPLLKVGGRGGAGYSIKLNIDQKWVIRKEIEPGQPNNYIPTPQWVDEFGAMEQTYSVGRVTSRQAGSRNYVTISPCGQVRQYTLTRLTFTAPDGTEYELRDTLRDGQPHQTTAQTCQNGAYFNRGKVFVTADGTSATFIADYDVIDYPFNNPGESAPAGYMILKDGTRFRVGAQNGPPGAIAWMRDRNGNLVNFGYGLVGGLPKLTSITDSLGRVITITNSSPTVITYKGFGGADRTVKVYITSLGTATLRPDFSVRTQGSLFPGLNNPEGTLLSTPQVIDSVELPDGRRYRFKYNSYAELARVVLPTGGAFEYDYAPGLTDGPESGMFTLNVSERQVYRRVVERRVYPGGGTGTAYAVKQVYSRPESGVGNAGYVDVQQCTSATAVGVCDVAATRLTSERHYYHGSARASFFVQPHQYGTWEEGKEYETRVYDPQTGALLRKVENKWEQPVNGATWPLASGTAETNGGARPNNPQITQTLTTLETGRVSKLLFAYDQYGNQTDVYEYDFGPTGSTSPGSFRRRSHTDFVTAAAYVNADVSFSAGAGLRGLPQQQWVSTDEAGSQSNWASLTKYEYDIYTTDSRHAPLVPRAGITGLCDSVNAQSQCVTSSPSSLAVRGNLTGVTTYANAAAQSGPVTVSKQYDVAGNVVKSVDAKGYETHVSYGDSFCNSGNGCGGSYTPDTFAFPSAATSPAPDVSALYGYPAGTFGTTQGLTTSTVYDFYTGLTYSTTDANNKTTTLSYTDRWGNPDTLDRARAVVRPDGGRTDVDYNDVVGNLYTRTLTDLDGARRVESYQFFDAMGRPVRSFLNEGGSSAVFTTADTEYDALGRARRVSSPYRTNGSNDAVNPSGRWIETTFDALGRTTEVKTTADGAKVTTRYEEDKVLVTDQAGVKRISRTDALGLLREVWEITPTDSATEAVSFLNVTYAAYRTTYDYDVLGNLKEVAQGTQPHRVFAYNSLSRLTSAANAESGTLGYTYDANGNLETKTDARGVTATYRYDRLNRNIITTYAGGGTSTPDVRRYYDGAVNGKGRLYWSEKAGVAATVFDSYDTGGRPTQHHQAYWVNNTWGQPFYTSRSYNKAGGVTSQTYPSGHTVTYGYDAAGRLGDNGAQAAFTGNLGDGVARTYASAVTYSEFGGLQEERFGTQTPLYHKQHYNARGQLYDIRLSTVPWATNEWEWNRGAVVNYYTPDCQWQASGAQSNGNLRCSEHAVPLDPNASYAPGAAGAYATSFQTYDYDALNRLTSVSEKKYATGGAIMPAFTQAYKYDRWGNRTVDLNQSPNVPAAQYDFDRENLQATNRLYAPGDTAIQDVNQRRMRYDAAGNIVHDMYTGGGGRVYDAENRMTAAVDRTGTWAYYGYDADGRRVRRKIANEEWWQVYGIDGELLAEYRAGAAPFLAAKEYGYRGSEMLVTMSSGDTERLTRFVKNLYYNCLARDASAAELQAKTNQLAQAGAQGGEAQLLSTARSIARELFESSEYTARGRTPGQYVTDLYNAYLQRGPDADGLTYWVGNTNTYGPGATLNAFEVSAEFSTLSATVYGKENGGEDQRVDAFVRNFYYGAFQRAPTAGEAQAARQRLNNAAAVSRDQVIAEAQAMAVELIQGTNYNGTHTPEQYVTDLYEAFLQRAPDGPGFTYWLNNVNTIGRAAALDGFKASNEYRELAGALYRETFWLVPDHLGTPRMVANRTGSLAGVKRHDYLPFGEELYAGMGGRTPTQGYGALDNVRQQFTSYERDGETGLDYAGARYYGSAHGRFTSPDDFTKDSNVADPQSWNKYAYVRNNPLKFIDPTGEKAGVVVETSPDGVRTITITGTIGIWADRNSGISQQDLNNAAQKMQEQINQAWSGSFKADGVKYNVKTDMKVAVIQGDPSESKADNVIEMKNGPFVEGGRLANGSVDVRPLTSGPDTGRMNIQAVLSGHSTARHEFGHMLGVGDKDDRGSLMYSDKDRPVTAPTSGDFALALNEAISHHKGKLAKYRYFGPAPGVTARSIVGYRPGVTATTVRAPYFNWK